MPRLKDPDLASLEALQQRFEEWLRDDYHLKRHGGIGMKPLDRYLAGAEATLIERLGTHEIDHAFMARMTRVVRLDATVKVDGAFYEVPPECIGERIDIRFPIARPEDLVLYRDDKPVIAIRPVDLVDNARFHAQPVELQYSELLRKRQQDEEEPS